MTIAALREEDATAEEAGGNQGRADLYALLSRAFSFPEASLHAELLDGRWAAELDAAVAGLPYPLKAAPAAAPDDYDLLQSEYIRLFEVGDRGGPPCPLHSGYYARDRLRVMEELIRFYNFFGLRIAPGLLPDHVTVQLEFMHCLALREATSADPESYIRAQRDFLGRHLAWWAGVPARLKRERPLPFYRSTVRLAAAFFAAEGKYLAGRQH